MSMRSGLTVIFSMGIAFSLMVSISGCASDNAGEQNISDSQPQSESVTTLNTSQPTTISVDDPD